MNILQGGKFGATNLKTVDEEFDFAQYDLLAWEFLTRE
jgi:hypothetical protein